jgi:cell division protein FtsI/penicillin-binding protein 2
VAVAVMLVGAGFGGTAAAPIAKQVLQAALGL